MRLVRNIVSVMGGNEMQKLGNLSELKHLMAHIIMMFINLMGTAPDPAQALMAARRQVEWEGLEGEKLMLPGMERLKL